VSAARLRAHAFAASALGLLLIACTVVAPAPASAPAPSDVPAGTVVDGSGAHAQLASFAEAHGLEGLPRAAVRIEGPGRALSFAVLVADAPAARARGLQGIDVLPPDVGMLFDFPDLPAGAERPGFWMLDTRLPLDIVFAAEGTVVGVATMTPCVARPCPITHPGVPYDVALEVAAGLVVAAGLQVGDRFVRNP
jgi:uncharacterized membrane protein (UPF0127 family)